MKIILGKPKIDMTSLGDTWDACWAEDDNLYASSDDTVEFSENPVNNLNKRPGNNLQFHLLSGNTPASLKGKTINRMAEYGGMTSKGPDGCMWKANGNICAAGNIYEFVSRHGLNFSARQTAENSSLIMSTDKGLTWKRTARENYNNPMFPGGRFGSPFFVKYGKDAEVFVHNADKYIYAVSNDGFWENGDDMILGRILKTKIPNLEASDWQFFTGKDGMADANWSPKLNEARPILVNPGKCSMTGVQYNAPLKRYLMIQWYYTKGSGHVAPADTAWIFYEAPAPWGPWTAFDEKRFSPEGYYNPCIVSKFISPDGLNLTILSNGSFMTAGAENEACIYRLTLIPCTLTL